MLFNETLGKKVIVACKQINCQNTLFSYFSKHYQSFISERYIKSVRISKIITYQPKTLKTSTLLI